MDKYCPPTTRQGIVQQCPERGGPSDESILLSGRGIDHARPVHSHRASVGATLCERRRPDSFIPDPLDFGAQLTNLTFQCLNPVSFFGRHAVAHAAVFLGLLDPSAQGLGEYSRSWVQWPRSRPLAFRSSLDARTPFRPRERGPQESSDLSFCFLS